MGAERRTRIIQIEYMLTKASSTNPANWIDQIIVNSLIDELEYLRKQEQEPDEVSRRATIKRDTKETIQTRHRTGPERQT